LDGEWVDGGMVGIETSFEGKAKKWRYKYPGG